MASPEALALAREEISVMKRLRHPNLLPLLGSALVSVDTAAGGRAQVSSGRDSVALLCLDTTLAPIM